MVTLVDVYYAPDFAKHILSLRKLLIDVGWHVEKVDKTGFVFQHSGGRQLRFERDAEDHLYYLKCARTQSMETGGPTVMTVSVTATMMDNNVAHGMLLHPDERTLGAVAKKLKWSLMGALNPCRACCALAKAKAKAVPKSTQAKATKPGERLFVDISGPYAINGSSKSNWLHIVDDHSRMTWNAMLAKKSGIAPPLEDLLIKNAAANKPCKYIRCDNAGENVKHIKHFAKSIISSWR